jgi:hypothetical protein
MPSDWYWWITSSDPETGKPYLIAGGRSEEEARQKAFEFLGGMDFKLKRLPTRNLARASSLLKGNRLEETKSLHKAAEKLGHERTVKRRLGSRSRSGRTSQNKPAAPSSSKSQAWNPYV